ncbi:MAG: metallophosphoesterase [Cyanobacteria bacterium SBLK]|nr:metallophosphoesterase [Cyanobacteria bacterium SBLK]
MFDTTTNTGLNTATIIAQLTDTHLLSHPGDRQRGCNPWQSLKAVLRDIAAAQPDYLLLTGDIADAGELTAYQQAISLIVPLQIPTYWLPGNHDAIAPLFNSFTHPLFHPPQATILGNWQLVTVDSTLSRACWGEGRLDRESLQKLEERLQRCHLPALIALHHHPLLTGLDWLDSIALQNADEFLALIDRFSHVRLVLFGHIHSTFAQKRGVTDFYGTPSTCLQLHRENSKLGDRQPGFRLLHLHPDGTHKTEVRRVCVLT